MKQVTKQLTKLNTIELLLFGALVLAAISPAFATEAAPEANHQIRPCAVVDSSSGEAQVLNSTRTQVAEAVSHTPVYCGGWVSVEQGWVILQHRFGYRIHVGPKTFVQFQDEADALILSRGQVFTQAGGGMGELRVLTPNARMRLSRGSVVTLFDPEEESTQVTTIDGQAQFENRFDSSKGAMAWVKSGHASALDFKLLRVVPSVPKVVATSSLKVKLKELHVPQGQSERALAVARNRQKELFAKFEKTQEPSRKIASTDEPHSESHSESHSGPKHTLKPRHARSSANPDDYLVRKTLGGSQEGMKILNPSHKRKTSALAAPRTTVEVEDPEAKLLAKQKTMEDAEKRRLIEELSKIRSE